MLFQAS
jgi:hypothetical protein